MVVEITGVLKCPNRTKNCVRHMVVLATWWSGTLVLRVRHADRQGIVASKILDEPKVAMMTYRAYMDEEVIQASRFEDSVKSLVL